MDSTITATPCVLNYDNCTFVVAATTSGNVCLIDIETGVITINFCLPSEIFSSPCVCDNKIYIGCRDNNLYCLQLIGQNKDDA